MAFEYYWLYEPRVSYGRFYGVVTMEELDEANAGAIHQIHSGTAPVHIIVDTLDITRVPASLKAITDLIAYTREPNLGYIVYVSNNPLINFLNSTIAQFSKAKFITVKTLDEALAILPRIDTSLEELMGGAGVGG